MTDSIKQLIERLDVLANDIADANIDDFGNRVRDVKTEIETLIGEPVAYLDPVDNWVLSKADYSTNEGMSAQEILEVENMYSIPLYRLDGEK